MPPATTSGGDGTRAAATPFFDDIQATGVHWLNGNYEDVEFKGRKLRIGGFFSSGPAPSWNGKTPAQWPTP